MVFFIIFLCISVFNVIFTEEKYSVDICFMIADLKYNSKQGVKICEIQHGSLSAFNGDEFLNPGEKSIPKQLLKFLSLYNKHGWVISNGITDKNLVSAFTHSHLWKSSPNITSLILNHHFTQQVNKPAPDIYDLSSYQGLLYIKWPQLRTMYDFEKKFPGIVIVDRSSFPFWADKYKMTQLFEQDEILAALKPKWGHYKKYYTPELASQIANDLQCDIFVIKPRGEFLGKGVIITHKQYLDEILSYIITKEGPLAENEDPAYNAWKNDPFDSFIVEEFIESDPITVPHLENRTYQPTMRVAFLLVYNKKSYRVHFLGEYWKIPSVALDQEGDFMEKNKTFGECPYYCAVDKKTAQLVRNELSIALPILHKKMMEFCPDSPEIILN